MAQTLGGILASTTSPGASKNLTALNRGGASTGVHQVGNQMERPLGAMAPRVSVKPGAKRPGAPKAPNAGVPAQAGAKGPQLGTLPPPTPHPGLRPPYPDARSPQPQLMPNGAPVLPPPRPPLGSVPPQMPPSFMPMPPPPPPSALPSPPTMPPVAQTQMPSGLGSMQMANLPPGGTPFPPKPMQAPQGARKLSKRPGMSAMLGR